MPLTWDITKCADADAIKTDQEWPVTNTIILLMPVIGVGTITEANAAEVYARLHLTELLSGPFLYEHGIAGCDRCAREGRHDIPITPAMVRARIGLRVNVGPETWAAFQRRIVKWVRPEAERAYREAIRKADAPTHPHPLDGTHEGLARDCEVCAAESDDEITREGRAMAAGGLI